MTPADAATVLAVIGVLDGRHKPVSSDEAQQKAKAWALVLDSDMPVHEARNLAAAHYSESSAAVMPADLNRAWRALRKERADAERQRRDLEARRAAELAAVPMPDEVRERLRRMIERTSRGELDAGNRTPE